MTPAVPEPQYCREPVSPANDSRAVQEARLQRPFRLPRGPRWRHGRPRGSTPGPGPDRRPAPSPRVFPGARAPPPLCSAALSRPYLQDVLQHVGLHRAARRLCPPSEPGHAPPPAAATPRADRHGGAAGRSTLASPLPPRCQRGTGNGAFHPARGGRLPHERGGERAARGPPAHPRHLNGRTGAPGGLGEEIRAEPTAFLGFSNESQRPATERGGSRSSRRLCNPQDKYNGPTKVIKIHLSDLPSTPKASTDRPSPSDGQQQLRSRCTEHGYALGGTSSLRGL